LPLNEGCQRRLVELDGVRVLLMVIPNDFGEVTTVCYSRNGKVFENFTHIEDQVRNNWLKMVRSSQQAI